MAPTAPSKVAMTPKTTVSILILIIPEDMTVGPTHHDINVQQALILYLLLFSIENDCGITQPANVISTSYSYNEADLSPFYTARQCTE